MSSEVTQGKARSVAAPAVAVVSLQLRFFASLREVMGVAELTVQAPCTTVGALRAWLRQQSPQAQEALAQARAVRCAVNQVLCPETQVLQSGDEVAFFPPVTGG